MVKSGVSALPHPEQEVDTDRVHADLFRVPQFYMHPFLFVFIPVLFAVPATLVIPLDIPFAESQAFRNSNYLFPLPTSDNH